MVLYIGEGPLQMIQLTISQHVATITLARHEAKNAIDLTTAKQLMDAALTCAENPEIRAVIIKSSDSVFSVGGDLKSFADANEAITTHLKRVTGYLHQAISYFTRMDKPVIAAVNGAAAGAGMSLVCACDLVYASNKAKFIAAYNKIDVTPDGSLSYFLPRIVGVRRAMELLYTNRLLTANEAHEWGIVNQVVEPDVLEEAVEQLALQLANGPIGAFAATKSLFYDSFNETLESQMQKESFSIAEKIADKEGQEGLQAFLEKREPKFL